MLNCGKKIRTLCDKKINILTFVLSEKKILNETKNHNLPFKLNARSLTGDDIHIVPRDNTCQIQKTKSHQNKTEKH